MFLYHLCAALILGRDKLISPGNADCETFKLNMQGVGQNLSEFFRASVAQMVSVVIIADAKPGVGGEVKQPDLRETAVKFPHGTVGHVSIFSWISRVVSLVFRCF